MFNSTNGNDPYLLRGDAVQKISRFMDRMDNMQGQGGIEVINSAFGTTIVNRDNYGKICAVVPTAIQTSRVGKYDGTYLTPLIKTPFTGDFNSADIGIPSGASLTSVNAIIINPFDDIANVHTLQVSTTPVKTYAAFYCGESQFNTDGAFYSVFLLPYVNPGLVQVNLDATGASGANGNATTKATYTYRCLLENGEVVPSGPFAPQKGRSKGLLEGRATKGVGFFGDSGFVLWDTNEIYETGAC